MELLLRVELGVDGARDVRAVLEPEHKVAELASALGLALTGKPWASIRIGRELQLLSPEIHIKDSGLMSGMVVMQSSDAPTIDAAARTWNVVELRVKGGPNLGLVVELAPGRHFVARAPDPEVVQTPPSLELSNDVTISRGVHLILDVVEDGKVYVRERAGVQNRATINGLLIDGEGRWWPKGAVLDVGDSQLELATIKRRTSVDQDQVGQLNFYRTPFRPVRPSPVEIEQITNLPKEPEPVKFVALTMLGPLLGGILMALVLSEPRFLAFALLGPIMTAASLYERKKTTTKKYEESVVRFKQKLQERETQLRTSLASETEARIQASPDLAELRSRAEHRMSQLWCRGRNVDEFLSLRVGVGNIPSLVSATPPRDGDNQFIEMVANVDELASEVQDVPITVQLATDGVLGVHGDYDEAIRLTKALVLQAACLHSPEDLVITSISSAQAGLVEWLKWLPHSRHTGSPLAGPHLGLSGSPEAEILLAGLREVLSFRRANSGQSVDRRWPWILLVVDRKAEPDPAALAEIMQQAPEAGISVIWASDNGARVPPECRSIVSLADRVVSAESRLWSTDPATPDQLLRADGVDGQLPASVALSLAPLRDASSASETASIPRTVPLFMPFGIQQATPEWIKRQWAKDRGYALEAVLGQGADGPLRIDMIEDGPHALIGGTSGSGKSELIQSMIAGLIISHSPADLNLLFIDFKGGSATEVFSGLPHVVGSVTDLDESLARRAQIAIRAELRRRVQLFADFKARDIAEMRQRAYSIDTPPDQQIPPEDVPGSLVIVVDEFATLKSELPEFMAEIVDIAQRGRSYGIHLLLATQRPSSSIDENIAANANLRISLRMLDPAESNSVIGAPDAAQIPVPLRGRALARLGPKQLEEFQSSFSGAPLTANQGLPPVVVTAFTGSNDQQSAPTRGSTTAQTTQLQNLVSAIGQLHWSGVIPQQVWTPPLPERLPNRLLRDQLAMDRIAPALNNEPSISGRHVLMGLVDRPAERLQEPLVVDLEAGGGLLVVGAGGSGKTTVLRTTAVNVALDALEHGANLSIFALDFAGGELSLLDNLPLCSAVGSADDLEATTRIIGLLEREVVVRRQARKADQEHEGSRVLLLIDGLPNLMAALDDSSGSATTVGRQDWNQRLMQLIADGRQLGIHVVASTSRLSGMPAKLRTTMTQRLALRLADEGDAFELEIPTGAQLRPGRAFFGPDLVQVACLAEVNRVSESAALVELVKTLPSPTPPLATKALPSTVRFKQLATAGQRCFLGIQDLTHFDVAIDLQLADLQVVGPPQSGRSNLLALIGRQLLAFGMPTYVIGSGASPLKGESWTDAAFDRHDAERLLASLSERSGSHAVVLVDDFDVAMADENVWAPLCRRLGPDNLDLRVVASMTNTPTYSQNPLYRRFNGNHQLVYLQPTLMTAVQNASGGRPIPQIRLGLDMPTGRGLLISRDGVAAVQTYLIGEPQ